MKFEQIDLGKIAEVLTGFPFKSKEFNEEGLGYFLIRGKNVSESFIKKGKDAKFWNHNLDKKMEKYLLKENDIVIGMDGSKVGKNVSKISTGEVPSLLVQRVARLRVKEGYDQNFLYYHFFNNRFNNYVNSIKTGTSIPHISPKQISEYQVTNFPINEQKRVVSIIEPILEKIELNNQIIATLEELAATLFKRWFVDFEFPDENGNPYKSSGGKMVDSELGEIPEGWEVKTLTEIAVYKNGLAMQKFRPIDMDNSLPVLKIKELNQGFVDSFSDRCSIDIKDDVKVFNGDVIFSWSGTLLVKLWTGGNAGLNQHLFKVTSDKFEKWFYYLWTRYYLNQFIAIAKDKATTMGHIKRENINNAKICYPVDSKLTDLFSRNFSPLIMQIIEVGIENNVLKQSRDALLPKLLSGELLVK